MIRLASILFMLLIVAPFAAHAAGAEGEKIADVSIKGNRRIETAAIANVIKTKLGDVLEAEKVDADIRAIFKLGHFQDVQAASERSEKGIALVFTVEEKPIVREVVFEGNKELSVEKLREAVEVKANIVFSAKDVTKSIKKLKKLYADEGYYFAEVDTKTEKRSGSEIKVVFKIVEGDKVLIKAIRFQGNKAFSDKQLKKVMETGESWMFSWLTGAGIYKEEVLKNDVNLVADLYLNKGYINVKVSEPKITAYPKKGDAAVISTATTGEGPQASPKASESNGSAKVIQGGLAVDIAINEGEQFRVGTLGFKGDVLDSSEELAKKQPMKSGDIFSRAELRTGVFNLTDFYGDKGYAFANINPLTKLNAEQKTVDLTFEIEKGEKVSIDRIALSGNTKTRDKVVRRELKLAEGDLYSSTALRKSRQNLMNLGYFEEANLATSKGSAPDKLNINVEVKEKPTGTFSIGAGYSSLDGIIGQGSVQQANFFGLGLKANAAASFGSKSKTYNIGLTDPYFLDSTWTLGADVYRTEREYLDYTRRATGGDIKAGHPLSDTVSTFWVYKYEEKNIFNESVGLLDNIRNGLITAPETSSTTSSIYASITRNSTDYRLDPTTGMINNLSIEYAGLGGTNRFVRYLANTTVFYPVFWNTVFSLRGELGHIQSTGKDVPIDEKFYLGGINTIRGYSSRTVSPFTNASFANNANFNGIISSQTNRVFLGGDTEAFFNAEYQFPLIKEAALKGVLFFDVGNSYDSLGKLFSHFQSSYGFGIRWASPMGPLRLEYGIPINPREGIDKASGRLEFSIGSFF